MRLAAQLISTITVDDWRPDQNAANGANLATHAIAAGAASSAGGATASLSDTAVVAAGDVPETMQENLTTAANAKLSRAKLDNIVPHLAASVGEVCWRHPSLLSSPSRPLLGELLLKS